MKFLWQRGRAKLPGEMTSVSPFSTSMVCVADRSAESTCNPINACTQCRGLSEVTHDFFGVLTCDFFLCWMKQNSVSLRILKMCTEVKPWKNIELCVTEMICVTYREVEKKKVWLCCVRIVHVIDHLDYSPDSPDDWLRDLGEVTCSFHDSRSSVKWGYLVYVFH